MFHIFKDHLYTVYSESESCSVLSDSLRPNGLYSPWNSPGQNTGMGSFSLLQGIFPTQGSNPGLPHCRQILYQLSHNRSPVYSISEVKSLSRVCLFAILWTVAYQAPPSMGFSRQEYWIGLPVPSPGDLPDPGIEPGSLALQADSHQGSIYSIMYIVNMDQICDFSITYHCIQYF